MLQATFDDPDDDAIFTAVIVPAGAVEIVGGEEAVRGDTTVRTVTPAVSSTCVTRASSCWPEEVMTRTERDIGIPAVVATCDASSTTPHVVVLFPLLETFTATSDGAELWMG